jgi:hypothetical protein
LSGDLFDNLSLILLFGVKNHFKLELKGSLDRICLKHLGEVGIKTFSKSLLQDFLELSNVNVLQQ